MEKDERELRVFLDHQIFTFQNYGGLSRIFVELYTGIQSHDQYHVKLPIVFSDNALINKFIDVKSILTQKQSFLKTLFYYFINRICTIYHLVTSEFDVFQPTYYDPYFLPWIDNKPFILLIADMTHEMFPGSESKKDKTIAWKKKLANKANTIIAISENTKKDIVNFYGIEPNKIKVIHCATSMKLPTSKINISLPARYMLFVGNRTKYKNFEFFFSSIKEMLEKDRDLFLVCAGSSPFTEQEVALFASNRVLNKIIHIKFSGDEELAYIYNKALGFIFPSLYEGFGIPVLEAFAAKCPVIVSNRSSLPEVGGNAVKYFDPEDASSIHNSVREVIYNDDLRLELIERGEERLKLFSWEKSIEKFIEIYKSI